jgi:hypothetical protein
MGLGGPGADRWLSRGGLGRALGSSQSYRIGFFSNLFLMPKIISENPEIALKARKILEKSQKFQENS